MNEKGFWPCLLLWLKVKLIQRDSCHVFIVVFFSCLTMSMWSGRSRSCCASAWIFFLAFFKVISRDSRPTPELKAPAKRVSVQRCPKVISLFRATVDTPPKLLPPPPFRSAETKVPIAELPPCAFSSNYGETTSVGLLKSLDLMVKYLNIWHNDSWFQNRTTGCANGICPVGGDFL